MADDRRFGRFRPAARSAFAVGLVLLAARGVCLADDEVPSLSRVVERLRALQEVDGEKVGYGSSEGEWFGLSKSLVPRGDEALFRSLLDDPNPVASAMGLFCLAARKGKDAAADLEDRLADRRRFEHCPGG